MRRIEDEDTDTEGRKFKRELFKTLNPDIAAYLDNKFVQNDNANETFSFSALRAKVAERELYRTTKSIYKRFAPEAMRQHGRLIYLHDFPFSAFMPYCSGWNLHEILRDGLHLTKRAAPAKHFDVFLGHCINHLNAVQDEWAGAIAYPNISAYGAAFIKKENLSFREIKQSLQRFVFNVNFPTRFGHQSPFLNVTVNLSCPKMLEGIHGIVGGEDQSFTHDELQHELDLFNTALFQVLQHGDYNGAPFTFPIPTIEIKEGVEDSCSPSTWMELGELTARRGSPYFINYHPDYMQETANLSMCCRLRVNYDEIQKHSGGTWAVGGNTGSLGVVTINLPRIGLISKSWDDVLLNLNRALDMAREYLNVKRKILTFWLKNGLLPVSKNILCAEFRNHFNTIGVVGAHEFVVNYMGGEMGITFFPGINDIKAILKHINERLFEFQKEDKVLYNLEQSPAESAAGKLAWQDRQDFGKLAYCNIIEDGIVEYTNSTHVPVTHDEISTKIQIEEIFHPYFTGGCLCNIFLGERADPKTTMMLVNGIAKASQLSYFALTPTISVCENCKKDFVGNFTSCPLCDGPVQNWSRVTGYYRPKSSYNPAKQVEFKRRYLHSVKLE